MIKDLGNLLSSLFKGFFFVVIVGFFIMKGCVQDIMSHDVPTSQVSVSPPTFDIKNYGTMVDVEASSDIKTKQSINNYHANMTIYDCPTHDSPVSNCIDVGTARAEYEGAGAIDAGAKSRFTHMFNFYNVPNIQGVLVPKLEITDFRG